MFNTKKFKQAFIEAGKQTAKKKQELVKKYKELQEKELVESKVNWTIDTVREMIETWNSSEGKDKMLLIYVMSSGQVGHIGSIGSMEVTGVDQTSVPQISREPEPSSKTEENELLTTDIDEVRRKFEHKIKMLGGEAQKIKRYGGNLDMVEGYIRGVKWALRKIWDIN